MTAPAAYGGIMDVDGRKRYGFGSRLRKLIPNEIARVAEVAAPFVAPFNAPLAGLMSGIGGHLIELEVLMGSALRGSNELMVWVKLRDTGIGGAVVIKVVLNPFSWRFLCTV